jgi:hypothetical protein
LTAGDLTDFALADFLGEALTARKTRVYHCHCSTSDFAPVDTGFSGFCATMAAFFTVADGLAPVLALCDNLAFFAGGLKGVDSADGEVSPLFRAA